MLKTAILLSVFTGSAFGAVQKVGPYSENLKTALIKELKQKKATDVQNRCSGGVCITTFDDARGTIKLSVDPGAQYQTYLNTLTAILPKLLDHSATPSETQDALYAVIQLSSISSAINAASPQAASVETSTGTAVSPPKQAPRKKSPR